MFVGGLSWQTTEETMKEYFGKFGAVVEAMVMRDPGTKHSRGFGFVTFADTESVEKVTQFGVHNLDGKKIDPKVAFPKESTPKVCLFILNLHAALLCVYLTPLSVSDGDPDQEDLCGRTLHHHHAGGGPDLLLQVRRGELYFRVKSWSE